MMGFGAIHVQIITSGSATVRRNQQFFQIRKKTRKNSQILAQSCAGEVRFWQPHVLGMS